MATEGGTVRLQARDERPSAAAAGSDVPGHADVTDATVQEGSAAAADGAAGVALAAMADAIANAAVATAGLGPLRDADAEMRTEVAVEEQGSGSSAGEGRRGSKRRRGSMAVDYVALNAELDKQGAGGTSAT